MAGVRRLAREKRRSPGLKLTAKSADAGGSQALLRQLEGKIPLKLRAAAVGTASH